MAGMAGLLGMNSRKDSKATIAARREALARLKQREMDTPTRVFGEAAKAILPDVGVLNRAVRDPIGTAKGAVEVASLASPAANAYRAYKLATGGGFSVTGAGMEDVEQAVEAAGVIPTGKAATLPAKFGIDLVDLGIRSAARRASPDMLSAASGGIVRGAPKPVRQARKKVATPEDINMAAWGDPMGAPRGAGEARLNPEGRRGTPRFYRGQQGLGKAETTTDIPTDAAERQQLADELGTTVDNLDQTVETINKYSTDVYKQNRGIGDEPVIVSVEKLATPETIKEVISKTPKRYGTLTEEQINNLTENINAYITDNPGAVWRMKDMENTLIAYTAIHHGDKPYWISGPGDPADWQGAPSKLNMRWGSKGK